VLKKAVGPRNISTGASLMQLKWKRIPFNGIQADLEQLHKDTETGEFSSLLKGELQF
jgi:hypothetical protein